MISLLAALTLTLVPWQRPGTLPSNPDASTSQDPGVEAAAPQGEGVPILQDLGDYWQLTFDETAAAMSLEAFVKICQQNTDINFTYSDDTAQVLQSAKVRMLGPKVVAKTDFYSFFQIIMIINRFVCVQIGPEHLSVVVVASLDSPQRSSVRADAVYVTPEELTDYADQPATLVNTVLHLPNIDVRTMGNAMRAMVVDPNTMQLVPIPESNSLILTGFGSNIASLAKMLKLINELMDLRKAEEVLLLRRMWIFGIYRA